MDVMLIFFKEKALIEHPDGPHAHAAQDTW